MPAGRRPSMADVADAAGVSHQTVSRVLNGHAYVREETRDRVNAAIERLGYRRNQAARALATARSGVIGVVTTGTADHGPASTVLAIERAARGAGRFVSLAALPEADADSARATLGAMQEQGVDGIAIVAPVVDVARLVDDVSLPIPVVVVAARGDAPEGSSVRYVAVDQRGGAAQATRHLVGLGHTGIAHVRGAEGWFDAIERASGYALAMEEAGLEPRVVDAGGWSARDGLAAAAALADDVRAGRITAIAAANDHLALGVIRALADRGLRVPDDASVVGFDDIDAGDVLIPSLTTVRQPFEELGSRVVDALLGGDARGVVEAELIVRESATRRASAPHV